MRPPICAICKKRFTPRVGGKLVSFKETEADKKYNEKFKEPGVVGHKAHREWFCNEHLAKAKSLIHLSRKEAMEIMKTSSE